MTSHLEKVTIHNKDRLLRRVLFNNPSFIKPDGQLASSCFSPKRGQAGLSVDIERLTTHCRSVVDKSRYRLYFLLASIPQKYGLKTEHDPLPENYAHALIKGNITRPLAKKLAMAANELRRIQFQKSSE